MNTFLKKLFLAIAIALTFVAKAQVTNTVLSSGLIFEGEPYLAVHPNNPQHLVAAWMDMGFSNGGFRITIKTRVSMDGGSNWSPAVSLPHMGNNFGSADPSLAFNKQGLLFICYIDHQQNPDSGGIYVARSSNGGLTWDTPTKAIDIDEVPLKKVIDRPWLVIDLSNTANANNLYITSKPAPWIAPPNRNYFKYSNDNGMTWSTIKNVDDTGFLIGSSIASPMAAPAVTSNGKFCAIYPSYVSSQNLLPTFYLASSHNNGNNFNYTPVYSNLPGANDTNLKNGYQLITHLSDSNKMAFIFVDAINGDADIKITNSADGGNTWNTPVRVNDDSIANGKAQDMVWGSYNEAGNLLITWRDRRNSNVNNFWNAGYDFYYATSTNNGLTFDSNKKISSQFIAFDSLISENGNDFMSCVYRGDTLHAVWGDTRSGKMKIYYTKTIVSTNTQVGYTVLSNPPQTFQLYPNPADHHLTVHTASVNFPQNIFIVNQKGQLISEQQMNTKPYAIDIHHLQPGIYYVVIDQEVMRFVKK